MDLLRARFSGMLRALSVVGLYCLVIECGLGELSAQTARNRHVSTEAAACGAHDVRTRHFLIHTDIPVPEANGLAERMETMLRLISDYWGRPMQGVIECYVVRDIGNFPVAVMEPDGIQGIATAGGVTIMRTATDGKRCLSKAVVYASARPEVVQHEAVHAYCHHTFGRIGPVWYAEGMAEMGHYWTLGDPTVRAPQREIKFLRENLPKSLAETLSPMQCSGDSWENYASRWALCHFLFYHPNYSPQFLALGRGLLTGRDASFEQTFGATARELWFEYYFFLGHIGPGYRVDLCAWDWNKKFVCLRPGRTHSTTVAAGRGWQPTGLTVGRGMQYEYAATGNCRFAGESKPIDANGDDRGRGRLVGALLKDYQLSAEFELGSEGSIRLAACGDLYLRCRNAWNELADDSGSVAVKFKLPGRGAAVARPIDTLDRFCLG